MRVTLSRGCRFLTLEINVTINTAATNNTNHHDLWLAVVFDWTNRTVSTSRIIVFPKTTKSVIRFNVIRKNINNKNGRIQIQNSNR